MTPEGLIKKQICLYLRSQWPKVQLFWVNAGVGIWDAKKGLYRKNMSVFQLNGVSDILGILQDGRFLAIEVKTKTGRISPQQQRFIDLINKACGLAFVARGIEDVQEMLTNK